MKTLRNLRYDKKGFTLIEIMIVVLIIGLLVAIAIPNFLIARSKSQTKCCISNLKYIHDAKEQYAIDGHADAPGWPEIMGPDKYIRGSDGDELTCPKDSSSYTINGLGIDPTCTNAVEGHELP